MYCNKIKQIYKHPQNINTYRPQAVAQSSHNPHPQNLQLMSVEHVLQTTSLQSSH